LCYIWADLHLLFLSLSSSEINSTLKAIFPNYWHSTPGKKPLFCAQRAQASGPKEVFTSACPAFSTGNLKGGDITLPLVDASKDRNQLSQARDANQRTQTHMVMKLANIPPAPHPKCPSRLLLAQAHLHPS